MLSVSIKGPPSIWDPTILLPGSSLGLWRKTAVLCLLQSGFPAPSGSLAFPLRIFCKWNLWYTFASHGDVWWLGNSYLKLKRLVLNWRTLNLTQHPLPLSEMFTWVHIPGSWLVLNIRLTPTASRTFFMNILIKDPLRRWNSLSFTHLFFCGIKMVSSCMVLPVSTRLD